MDSKDDRRRITAGLGAVGLAVGTFLVAVATSPAPASAVTPPDEPLLYAGFSSGTLKTLSGTPTALGFQVDPVAAFSPDGESIASAHVTCADDACDTSTTVITIHHVDGTSVKLADFAGDVDEIAWSGDGAQLVALVGYTDAEIWRIGLDGSAPVKVLGTTSSFRVEGDGLDWSRTSDKIAFIGTPLDADGSSLAKDTSQVYTVASTGGAPTQYSQVLPDCEFPSCTLDEYSHPRFAPDGSRIAAFVNRDYENYDTDVRTVDEFVGILTAGQPPTNVRSILSLTNPSSWSGLAIDGPLWSSDGSRLLYSQYDDQSLDTRTARVVRVADGTVNGVSDPQFRDWQPCPTGECASWGTPPDDCTIRGTSGPDRLVGTAGRDVVCGLEGDDVLIGNGGNDVLRGGPGQDQLAGGPGADVLYGEEGPDSLRGDTGNDTLSGGSDPDLVTYFNSSSKVTVDLAKQSASAGTQGRDKLIGIEGVFGSKTGDVLIGSSSSNNLYGGPGADVLRGNGGTDSLNGNDGPDQLFGGSGADLLQGLGGSDVLKGGDAADACYDSRSGTTRRSCELGGEGDPPRTTGPVAGADDGTVDPSNPRVGVRGVARVAGGLMYYWYIGKGDYMTVYDAAATQNLASWVSTPSWEGQICRFIRNSPARGACSAANALNAVSKYQMKWFLWNAKRNGGCAIGILDWGHHGVIQIKSRWKARAASYGYVAGDVAYISPGRVTMVDNSVGGVFGVHC